MPDGATGSLPDETFFDPPSMRTIDGVTVEWFQPTDLARGPWDPNACHAGPPTAALAGALEAAIPEMQLVRITVDLAKPVPHAGFGIHATTTRRGRIVGATRAELVDGDGTVKASATGLHITARSQPLLADALDNSGVAWPRLTDAGSGSFPFGERRWAWRGFRDAVETRYPSEQDGDAGATTVWLRTVGIVPGEEPSPFQRICPLADCGNAFSRHREPEEMGFVNADLTVSLHRAPVGEWLGMRAVSQWQPTGVGLVTSSLFDDRGSVGTALQTLVLTPA